MLKWWIQWNVCTEQCAHPWSSQPVSILTRTRVERYFHFPFVNTKHSNKAQLSLLNDLPNSSKVLRVRLHCEFIWSFYHIECQLQLNTWKTYTSNTISWEFAFACQTIYVLFIRWIDAISLIIAALTSMRAENEKRNFRESNNWKTKKNKFPFDCAVCGRITSFDFFFFE